MTAIASRQPPSKMGFKVGEVVTVDNALKIIMVKSANDVAQALGVREEAGGVVVVDHQAEEGAKTSH